MKILKIIKLEVMNVYIILMGEGWVVTRCNGLDSVSWVYSTPGVMG